MEAVHVLTVGHLNAWAPPATGLAPARSIKGVYKSLILQTQNNADQAPLSGQDYDC